MHIDMLNLSRKPSIGIWEWGYNGCKFTWSCRSTKERLDRVFQNPAWKALHISRVCILPPSEFDHLPLLLEIGAQFNLWRAPKRFCFEEMWHNHADCIDIIRKGWSLPLTGNGMDQIGVRISQTGSELLQWYKNVFNAQHNEFNVIQGKLHDIMRQPFSPDQFEEQKPSHSQLSALFKQ